jgi:hypothetical protein
MLSQVLALPEPSASLNNDRECVALLRDRLSRTMVFAAGAGRRIPQIHALRQAVPVMQPHRREAVVAWNA